MKTVIKILFTQFVAMYWKKFISLTVAGSLLLSLIVPPFAHAYSVRSEMECLESSQREGNSSRPERYKLRKESELIEGGKLASRDMVLAMAAGTVDVERFKDRSLGYSNGMKGEGTLPVKSPWLASANDHEKWFSRQKVNSTMNQYDRNLKESGIRIKNGIPHVLNGSRFRISSLRRAIGSITLLHAGRIERAIERRIGPSIERLTSLGGGRIWDSIENMTALHAGPFIMHIRKIFENYSLLNLERSFAYLFRAALDGNRDQVRKVTRYEVEREITSDDNKWEYVLRENNEEKEFPVRRLLRRVMQEYGEKWEVLVKDFYGSDLIDGEWVDVLRKKAERTIGDYRVAPYTKEELDFDSKFSEVYQELINNEYDYLEIDDVWIKIYDGPGFIWSEDVFELAYYYTKVIEINGLDRRIGFYEERKDENYYSQGYFWIDRRYAHILIEYGKKYGQEALRKLMRRHAERELLAQTNIARGDDEISYDKAHEDILDDPGQRGLMGFAVRAANDIRLGDFEDYLFVRDLWDASNLSLEVRRGALKLEQPLPVPENRIGGLFGEYLISLYNTILVGRDYMVIDHRTLESILLFIRKDKELYLEYKKEIEEFLSRNRNATRKELCAIRDRFKERLKEREREKGIQSFIIRNARFVRWFGEGLVRSYFDELIRFEEEAAKIDTQKGSLEVSFGIFDEVFPEIQEIVTNENFMELAWTILELVKLHQKEGEASGGRDTGNLQYIAEEVKNMMLYFGPKRTLKKLRPLIEFAKIIPWNKGRDYIDWRIEVERDYLRWLYPNTYNKEEKAKRKWKRMDDYLRRKFEYHSWILYVGVLPVAGYILSGGAAYSYDGYTMLHTSLNIWNEIVKSVSALLPYLTIFAVSALFASSRKRDKEQSFIPDPTDTLFYNSEIPGRENSRGYSSGIQETNNPRDNHLEVQDVVQEISLKVGDSEEIVREVLSPTLYQALKGIVEDQALRVLIHRSDLKSQIPSLKRLMEENEGEKRFEPVVIISRQFKEREMIEVKRELKENGIDPEKVKILDQAATEDGRFSLKALFIDYPELIQDGYSLWVINSKSWVETISQVLNPMQLMNGSDLVELDLKAEFVVEIAQ